MARIFLSYDHDDAVKARSIALALEKAGHSVWWDLHVRSGAQFSKVIEQSLNAADVVVVLWSQHAVESAWVRDEAASGRDTGRLVPVTLDGTQPPLGFRQFQTVDFSRWNGRRKPPGLQTLLADVATIAASQADAPVRPATPRVAADCEQAAHGRRFWLPIGGALAALTAGGSYFLFSTGAQDATTLQVIAATPTAKALAEDVLVDLGTLRSVQLGSARLISGASKQRPDLVLQVGGATAANGALELVLKKVGDGPILWAKQFERGGGNGANLRQRMVYTAGRVLGCALEGLQAEGKPLGSETLKLYLTGCSHYAEASNETRISVIPIFLQVVSDAPRFGPAWAKLLLAEGDALAEDDARDQTNQRQYISAALALDPKMPEAALAQAGLLPARAFGETLRLVDQARVNHPENVFVLGYRSIALSNVGRMNEAIEDAKEAARLDPTSPHALHNYVLTLAYSGRIESARTELQRAERLWAGTEMLADLQYAFQLRFGDARELLESERFRDANPRMQMYYRTRADPTPANIDRFMAFLQGLYSRRGLTSEDIVGHSQAYGEFQREDDLYKLIFRLPPRVDISRLSGVVFRPSLRKFRHDPRFMIVAKRMGLLNYWMSSGKWPDFCFDPDQPYDCKAQAAKHSSGTA